MTRSPRSATRAVRAASSAALGVAAGAALATAVAVSAPTAAQADTYRYWTYWKAAPGESSWAFSPAGASSRPADGAVEGWRFALSGVAGSAGTQPRATPTFDSICGSTQPASGGIRVAVVVDFGSPDAQPPGEAPPRGVVAYCATRAPTLTGLDALAAGPWGPAVRTSGGLVCGIDGYPRTECGARVAAPAPTAAPAPSSAPLAAAAPKPPAPAASSARPTSTASAPPSPGTTASATPGDPPPSEAASPLGADGTAPESVTATRSADAATAPSAASASTSTDAPGGPPAAALAGFGLVAGLGGAAWWRMRVGR